MLHSTKGVEKVVGHEGWLHALVSFAYPFRMPDFFLISGLFLARVIERDWRTYIDRKVIHFAYFYFLWLTIQFAFKAPLFASEGGWLYAVHEYLLAFVQPYFIMWFIYLLPIFFVVTKLVHGYRLSPLLVWSVAAGLEIAHIYKYTEWLIVWEFACRFVYFYTGYLLAPYVFRLAEEVQARPFTALAALAGWAGLNGLMVFEGYSEMPVISLALGFVGAAAVISIGALLARSHLFNFVRYCGRHSIVIYLAFFFPVAVTRTFLLKFDVISDVGTVSLLLTAAGVMGALSIFWTVRGTRLGFLFERPELFWIVPKREGAHSTGSMPALGTPSARTAFE
jgi:uncharacterized membrane protein YcfT